MKKLSAEIAELQEHEKRPAAFRQQVFLKKMQRDDAVFIFQ